MLLAKTTSYAARVGTAHRIRTRTPVRRYTPSETKPIDVDNYPPSKINTILNICSQGEQMVVERFGRFHSLKNPGLFLAIPIIDRIAYVHDMRELALYIEPQKAVTADNVSVHLSGNLFVQILDAKAASYNVRRVLYAVQMHAQSVMRTACGKHELDELFHNRKTLNETLVAEMQEAGKKWACDIIRYEVTDIRPDKEISTAMDKQAAAERIRRAQVLSAMADKQSMVEVSEGQRQKDINESEGIKMRILNETDAKAKAILQVAQAEAESTIIKAKAQADAIANVANALQNPGGDAAMQAGLSADYFKSFEKVVGESNTVILPQDVGSADGMVARAVTLLQGLKNDK